MELPRIWPKRKSGNERFQQGERDLGFDLLDFWQWSSSDLLSNATRGVLAEYLVGRALGAVGAVRDEWAAYDLVTPEGVKVEVKSAAYVQSWYQRRHSTISFGVPETLAWDADTNLQSKEPHRHADVYVFCLLTPREQERINSMDVAHWEFYAVPTSVLDERTRSQRSITLPSLQKVTPAVTYEKLRAAVAQAAGLETDENS